MSLSFGAMALTRNHTQNAMIIEYVVIARVRQAIFESQDCESSGFQSVRTADFIVLLAVVRHGRF